MSYVLTYLEKDKKDFTMEELPTSCDTLQKAKARASLLFTGAVHKKEIVPISSDGSFAYLHDKHGNVVSFLVRSGERRWAWQ